MLQMTYTVTLAKCEVIFVGVLRNGSLISIILNLQFLLASPHKLKHLKGSRRGTLFSETIDID